MNVFYMTFRLFLSMLLLLQLLVSMKAQVMFKAYTVENVHFPALQEELSDYRVIHLDSWAILDLVQKTSNDAELIFLFNDNQNWHIRLQEEDIRAQNYQVQTQSEKGVQKIAGNRAKTFAGQVLSPEKGACRLTLAAGFVYGVFEIGEETWFIEPAKRFDQDAGFDAYLLYKMEDVLPNPDGHCAAIEMETIPIKTDQQKSAGECYAIEIALAADYQMLQLFGNVEMLENYVLGILNNVHTNYDEEFEHTIRFKAVTLYVSTCATCDPWAPLTDYLQLLANFRDWSNGGGFEMIYDLATLWTGRVLDNNIGGGGYFGGLCSNQRYQLLRRYSANAALMRALQTHELGHNLNARHDADGSPYIMAPRIQDVHEWSSVSKNTINTYFNSVVNAQNCVSTCENAIAPQSAFYAIANTVCAPSTVQFFNQSSTNASSWQWLFPEGLTSFDKNPVATFTVPGSYKVQLVAANAEGFDTSVIFISVKGKPDAAFSFDQVENMVTFSNQSINTQTYLWQFGDNNSSTLQHPIHTYANPGTYNVQLIAMNECGSDTLQQTIALSGTAPLANFNSNIQEGCAPFSVQFSDLTSGNASKRNWYFPSGNPNTSQNVNPLVNYEEPGRYSVTLIVENFWGKDTLTLSDYIEVFAQPDASFEYTVDGQEVIFQSVYAYPDWQYEWRFGDGAISNEMKPSHFFAHPGEYRVELRVTNNCGAAMSSKTLMIVTTSTTLPDFLNVFRLSPNPASYQVELILQGRPQKHLQARLVNALGQKLRHWQVDFSSGDYKEIVDCSKLAIGAYWLEIIGLEGTVSRAFILQKP
ncbi:MAG: PKD domain-containing protein [Saprospiraceae bacterium]|nr:PKD domain-containing protein [Saprospiraceae bacterium]